MGMDPEVGLIGQFEQFLKTLIFDESSHLFFTKEKPKEKIIIKINLKIKTKKKGRINIKYLLTKTYYNKVLKQFFY